MDSDYSLFGPFLLLVCFFFAGTIVNNYAQDR